MNVDNSQTDQQPDQALDWIAMIRKDGNIDKWIKFLIKDKINTKMLTILNDREFEFLSMYSNTISGYKHCMSNMVDVIRMVNSLRLKSNEDMIIDSDYDQHLFTKENLYYLFHFNSAQKYEYKYRQNFNEKDYENDSMHLNDVNFHDFFTIYGKRTLDDIFQAERYPKFDSLLTTYENFPQLFPIDNDTKVQLCRQDILSHYDFLTTTIWPLIKDSVHNIYWSRQQVLHDVQNSQWKL